MFERWLGFAKRRLLLQWPRMEKYEMMGVLGEGSYGIVHKCRNRETGQIVAIKKFNSSESDKFMRKTFQREVKFLKQLRHKNLVNLKEVFHYKKKRYLVFEYVDHTLLDELERNSRGLDEQTVRKYLWQILKAVEFCHANNIIHRDVKPENILVSYSGVVKLCDFGFARTLVRANEEFTDYVATRWYRAPELILCDPNYGRPVDVWAVGCVLGEMLTGDALFQGVSETDQLFIIVKCFGKLTEKLLRHFPNTPAFANFRPPQFSESELTPLEKLIPNASPEAFDFVVQCLRLDADDRSSCTELQHHRLFSRDDFLFSSQAQVLTSHSADLDDTDLPSLTSRTALQHNSDDTRDKLKRTKNSSPSLCQPTRPAVASTDTLAEEDDEAPKVSLFGASVSEDTNEGISSVVGHCYLPPVHQSPDAKRKVHIRLDDFGERHIKSPVKKGDSFHLPQVSGSEAMNSKNLSKSKRNFAKQT